MLEISVNHPWASFPWLSFHFFPIILAAGFLRFLHCRLQLASLLAFVLISHGSRFTLPTILAQGFFAFPSLSAPPGFFIGVCLDFPRTVLNKSRFSLPHLDSRAPESRHHSLVSPSRILLNPQKHQQDILTRKQLQFQNELCHNTRSP